MTILMGVAAYLMVGFMIVWASNRWYPSESLTPEVGVLIAVTWPVFVVRVGYHSVQEFKRGR